MQTFSQVAEPGVENIRSRPGMNETPRSPSQIITRACPVIIYEKRWILRAVETPANGYQAPDAHTNNVLRFTFAWA